MGTVAVRTLSPHKLGELLVVGKDVLELLSSAMYVDPLCIYREYIQNAADAIDEAEAARLYRKESKPRIDVSIDRINRNVRIRDNGTGISASVFQRKLTALGASQKRGSNARGFRGVGRLSGLAYCQELVFRAKSKNDLRVREVRWDCRRLKDLLADSAYQGDVNDLVYEITKFDSVSPDNYPSHFFEVELMKVNRIRDDLLLNETAVENYLAQVGPVPFANGFSFGKRIMTYLAKHGVGASYNIYLNGDTKPIQRPFKNNFEAKQTVIDKFSDLETFEIPGVNGGTDAAGWVLHHNYYGALPERLGIKGVRLRLGNIQIGDDKIFESTFPETRFNGWAVGEVHIVSSRLVPNARRDDLEQTIHQQNLLNHVTSHSKRIAKLCRSKSAERNRAKKSRQKDRDAGCLPRSNVQAVQSWLRSVKCEQYLSNIPAARRKAYQDLFCLMLRSCKSKNAAKNLICEVLPNIAHCP